MARVTQSTAGWPKDQGIVAPLLKTAKLFCIRDCVRALKVDAASLSPKNIIAPLPAEEKETLLSALKKLNSSRLWQLYRAWLTSAAATDFSATLSLVMYRATLKQLQKHNLILDSMPGLGSGLETNESKPQKKRKDEKRKKLPRPSPTHSNSSANENNRRHVPKSSHNVDQTRVTSSPRTPTIAKPVLDSPEAVRNLHPSWAAKKLQQHKIITIGATPQSSHMTFD